MKHIARSGFEFIAISFYNDSTMYFPNFKEGTMYKNMKKIMNIRLKN